MNRRQLLKSTILAGGVSFLPRAGLLAAPQKDIRSAGGFKKIMLGELEIIIISDGHILEKTVQPFIAPRGPAAEVKALLEKHFRPTDSVDLAMNLMLVRSGKRVYLLDTGMGMFADRNTGLLLKSMQAVDIKPEQITDIIISHAHPDHIGGVVNKDGVLRFPKANIYLSKTEHDFWMKASMADFQNSPLKNEPAFLDMFIPAVRKILSSIKPQLRFLDFSQKLDNIFTFQPAPGHTPGLIMTTINAGDEKLMYIADLIHSDAVLFEHPEWGFSGDTDLDLAIESRVKLLDQLAATRTRTFAYHLPWPGLGHVRKKEIGFEWVPELYATP